MKGRYRSQYVARGKLTKKWIKYFEEVNGRKPTEEEGRLFGQGFNMGWKSHCKVASHNIYSILSNLINNLEDDLQLDLSKGDSGYKSKADSYDAVNKFTLKILKRKMKAAEHNYKLNKNNALSTEDAK